MPDETPVAICLPLSTRHGPAGDRRLVGRTALAERRGHLYRRHGLRRHRTLWRHRLSHAKPGSHGPGRHEVYRFRSLVGGLLGLAGRRCSPAATIAASAFPERWGRSRRTASTPTKSHWPKSASRRATPRPSSANGTWAIIPSSCRCSTASTNTSACPTPTTCGRCTPSMRTCPRPRPIASAGFPDLPLIDGNRVANPKVTGDDQAQLTTWYTEHAVELHRPQ